jgi:SsrA-binding protein
MSPKSDPVDQKTAVSNRRARHDFEISSASRPASSSPAPGSPSAPGSLREAFARARGGEVWVEWFHIPPYEQAMDKTRWDPIRTRKLLLHRREIDRLIGTTAEKGLALVPLRVYFAHGIAKMELGLGRGKRQFEKRQAIAEREHQLDIQRELGRRR